MRATTIKKRFIIEPFSTDSTRWFLYDRGVKIGRVVKSDTGQTHAIILHKGSALAPLHPADLSDLLCMLRELDSL
jgi:hypothetical protein